MVVFGNPQPAQQVAIQDLPDTISSMMKECYTKYEENISKGILRLLLYGRSGSGKTVALRNARKPIFVHSFDPGGSTVKPLRDLISSHEMVVSDRFEGNRAEDFPAWLDEYNKLKTLGFFDRVGTYVLDSMTLWAHTMMTHILSKSDEGKKRKLALGIMATREQRDYDIQQLWGVQCLLDMCSLPCDLIVTGHLTPRTDESGERVVEYGVSVPGQFSQKTLNIFPEKWVTTVQDDFKSSTYKYMTQSDGKLIASTKIGFGKFEKYEEPDIKKLMAKAGFPYEDRPNTKLF